MGRCHSPPTPAPWRRSKATLDWIGAAKTGLKAKTQRALRAYLRSGAITENVWVKFWLVEKNLRGGWWLSVFSRYFCCEMLVVVMDDDL